MEGLATHFLERTILGQRIQLLRHPLFPSTVWLLYDRPTAAFEVIRSRRAKRTSPSLPISSRSLRRIGNDRRAFLETDWAGFISATAMIEGAS